MLAEPAFDSLDRATLGHLWWTLHLASTVASLEVGDPLLPNALHDLQDAIDRTATMRVQLFMALRTQALSSIVEGTLWD